MVDSTPDPKAIVETDASLTDAERFDPVLTIHAPSWVRFVVLWWFFTFGIWPFADPDHWDYSPMMMLDLFVHVAALMALAVHAPRLGRKQAS